MNTKQLGKTIFVCYEDGKEGKVEIPNLNGIFTASGRIKAPKSRKRFVKFLMANGVSRNTAQEYCKIFQRWGYSWNSAFCETLLSSLWD